MKPGTGTPLTTLKGFITYDNCLAASSFEKEVSHASSLITEIMRGDRGGDTTLL